MLNSRGARQTPSSTVGWTFLVRFFRGAKRFNRCRCNARAWRSRKHLRDVERRLISSTPKTRVCDKLHQVCHECSDFRFQSIWHLGLRQLGVRQTFARRAMSAGESLSRGVCRSVVLNLATRGGGLALLRTVPECASNVRIKRVRLELNFSTEKWTVLDSRQYRRNQYDGQRAASHKPTMSSLAVT